jgi:hypothetical protein
MAARRSLQGNKPNHSEETAQRTGNSQLVRQNHLRKRIADAKPTWVHRGLILTLYEV